MYNFLTMTCPLVKRGIFIYLPILYFTIKKQERKDN